MYGKGDGEERAEYHNGEGVYIGTSPESDGQPMSDNDTSSHNVVARNIIRTFGSECFNVKENAHDNVFEDNVCSSNAESSEFEGSNVELRGYANIVRNNQISDSAGYSIKIQTDGEEYDRGGNVVENNQLSGAAAETFKIKSDASQGRFCGNSIAASGARVQRRQRRHDAVGDHHPADPLRAAPARVVVDSGNGRLRYRVNPGAATVQRWIPSSASPRPCGRRPHGRGGAHLARLASDQRAWPPAPYRRTTPRTPSAGAGSTRRPITAA